MESYTKKYLFIYTTQIISIILGVVSLFVVIPFLSSNKEIYGIYAVCSSLTVFFSYADIGFITSGQKFAAEAFIKGDRQSEIKILGFSCFVLMALLIMISLTILLFVYNPSLLIKDLTDNDVSIARSLLLILALSAPVYCFQRIAQILYAIRLADYYYQSFQIVGSLLKIFSVFFFFGNGKYDIVGYYFTFQVINLIVVIFAYTFAQNKFSTRFLELLKHICFQKDVFDLLGKLALASLFTTVCWILYYELDNIAISKLLGAESVALYAVAFSILSMFRSVFGACYSPYTTRFNYFVGLNDIEGLNAFVKRIIEFFLPITLIPILVISINSYPFICSWVGPDYDVSADVLFYLLFCNLLAFLSYPAGLYITALQKNRYLYISNIIIVIVFWGGVMCSYKQIGVVSFAVMKALGMIASAIYSYLVLFKIMNETVWNFTIKLIKNSVVPISICVILSYSIKMILMIEKGFIPLLVNVLILASVCVLSYLIYLFFNTSLRTEIKQLVSNIRGNKL